MSKTCRVCQSRKVAQGIVRGQGDTDAGTARAVELCIPCFAEAGWENEHSDDGHGTEHEGSNSTDYCWICHPELNEAAATYVARVGTSRAGMVITVPLKASGQEKAAAVKAQIPTGYAVGIKTVKGVTTLKAAKGVGDGLVLQWDAQGRFVYGPSTANGKKVRNVAAALRILKGE
jgi:hypothetical protein